MPEPTNPLQSPFDGYVLVGAIEDKANHYGYIPRVFISADGKTFNQFEYGGINSPDIGIWRIIYGAGVFVGTAGYKGGVYGSFDGQNWSQGSFSDTLLCTKEFADVVYGDGCFYGQSSILLYRSDFKDKSPLDTSSLSEYLGFKWYRDYNGTGGGTIYYLNNRFISIDFVSQVLYTINKGDTWVRTESPLPIQFTYQGNIIFLHSAGIDYSGRSLMVYGNGVYLIFSGRYGVIDTIGNKLDTSLYGWVYRSANLKDWSLDVFGANIDGAPKYGYVFDVVFFNKKFMVLISDGNPATPLPNNLKTVSGMLVSTDGANWSYQSIVLKSASNREPTKFGLVNGRLFILLNNYHDYSIKSVIAFSEIGRAHV